MQQRVAAQVVDCGEVDDAGAVVGLQPDEEGERGLRGLTRFHAHLRVKGRTGE